jgi:hypothetical protein
VVRLVKTTNGLDANEPPGPFIEVGDAVTWSYEIFNDGNVALNELEVIDDHGTPADETDDFSVCLIPDLPAGESTTCQSTGTAITGQYSNQASVSGTPPGDLAAVSDEDNSHYFGAMPSLLLIKKTNGEDAAAPPGPEIPVGETVTWTYLVNNNGNVVLSDLVIRDDNGTPVDEGDDFTVCTISTLGVSSSQTCTYSGTSAPGQYANTATATASPPDSLAQVSASDVSHYYGGGELYSVYLPLIMR